MSNRDDIPEGAEAGSSCDAGPEDCEAASEPCVEPEDCKGEFLWKMVERTVAMEEARCESLRRMCDGLLTGASIASVALLTVAEPVFCFFDGNIALQYVMLAVYAVALLLLLLSMIFAVVSMTRFKYEATDNPGSICMRICDFDGPLSSLGAARSFAEVQERVFQSYIKRNDKIRWFLVVAQWLLVAALIAIVLGGAFLFVAGCVVLGQPF